MGNFTKSITKHYEFDGDTIQVTMRRLTRGEAMSLTPSLKEAEGEVSLTFKDQLALASFVVDMFPDIIESLSGLYIDGKEVVYNKGTPNEHFDDFLGHSYFMQVHSMIMVDLMEASFVMEDDKKKSVESPDVTSQESHTLSTVQSVG